MGKHITHSFALINTNLALSPFYFTFSIYIFYFFYYFYLLEQIMSWLGTPALSHEMFGRAKLHKSDVLCFFVNKMRMTIIRPMSWTCSRD